MVIVGILTTVAIVSYSGIQAGSRDSQRSSKATIISGALEKYYDQNGEYPNCENVNADTLKIDPDVLTTPSDPAGQNSIECSSLSGDKFNYIGGGTSYTLEYKKESGGAGTVTSLRDSTGLTLATIAGTGGTVKGGGIFAPDSIQTITATPNTNYSFTGWSGSTGCSGLASHTITMDTAKTCTANFTPIPIATPTMTTVAVSTLGNATTWSWPAVSCSAGTTARYQYDYLIDSISIAPSGWKTPSVPTATSIAFTTGGSLAFEGHTYSVKVRAQCYNTATSSSWSSTSNTASYTRPITTYTLTLLTETLRSGPGGSVSQSGTSPYNVGSTPTITATFYVDYQFVSWSGSDGCSGLASHTITMNANKTCTATFDVAFIGAPVSPPMTVSTSGNITTFSWSGEGLCPTPYVRYEYDYLIDSVSQAPSGWKTPTDPSATSIAFTTGGAPAFEGRTYTVQVRAQCYNDVAMGQWSTHQAIDDSNPASYYRPITTYILTLYDSTGGTVNNCGGNCPSNTYNSGTTQTITATPNTYYQFTSWTGSTGCSGLASHTIIMDGNKTCTANFTPIPIATPTMTTVTASTSSNTTTWSWPAVSCSAGTTARYQYDYLIDGVSQSPSGWKTPTVPTNTSIAFTTGGAPAFEGRTYSVKVRAQCYNPVTSSSWSSTSNTVNYYRPITTYTLTIIAEDCGGNCPGQGTVNTGGTFNSGSTPTITATPSAGYFFLSWAGDTGCSGVASHTITMNGNKTCTATFMNIPAQMTVVASTTDATYTTYYPTNSPLCPTGTTARYQYNYTMNNGYDSGWVAIVPPNSFTATTASEGYTYTVAFRMQCYSAVTTSPWNTPGSASYYRPIITPTTPVVTTSTIGDTTTWSWPSVTCAEFNSARYESSLNLGNWTSVNLSTSFITSAEGSINTVRIRAQCYNVNTSQVSPWSGIGSASYTRPITAPTLTGVSASTSGNTTTWSWPASTCAAGTVARYQYDYFIDSVSQAPSGWKTPTDPSATSIAFTTGGSSVFEGHTYTVGAQARCYNTSTSVVSAWSGGQPSSADYYRPITTYTLAISAGTGGTVNTAVNGTYNAGTTPTITATPNTGYTFSSWSGGGNCSGTSSHTILMNANQTCTANFTPISYTLTLIVDNCGGNCPGRGTVSGGGSYNYGTTPTITATPSTYYQFYNWTGSTGCSGVASHTITINENKTCTASFTPTPIATPTMTTVTASTPSNTTTWSWPAVSCSGNTTIYQYDYLIDGVSQSPSGWKTPTVPTATSISFTTGGSSTFEGHTYSVKVRAQCYNTATSSSWSSESNTVNYYRPYTYTLAISAGSNGTVNTAVNGTYSSGTNITITATPSTYYQFSSWTGSTGCSGTASHTITMNGNKTCTANFIPITYVLTIYAGAGGTVNNCGGNCPSNTYNAGTTQTITATPNAGYAFSSWTGSTGCSGVASHTITMNGNKTCTANFVATYTLTLIVEDCGGNCPNYGTVSGGGTYNSGSVRTITATPNSGHTFGNWTGSTGCSGTASHTITMDGNKTCTAYFY